MEVVEDQRSDSIVLEIIPQAFHRGFPAQADSLGNYRHTIPYTSSPYCVVVT